MKKLEKNIAVLDYIEEIFPDASLDEKLAMSHELRRFVKAWWNIAARLVDEEVANRRSCPEGVKSASVEDIKNP